MYYNTFYALDASLKFKQEIIKWRLLEWQTKIVYCGKP